MSQNQNHCPAPGSFALMALLRLLNEPPPLPWGELFRVLDTGPPRTLLVLSPRVAQALLRSPEVKQTSIWDFYSLVTGLKAAEVPTISDALKRLPLSQDGGNHRNARLALIPHYRRVESVLVDWLDAFCDDFLNALHDTPHGDIISAAGDFSDRVNRTIVGRDLALPAEAIPTLPDGVFSLLPVARKIRLLDQQLAAIRQTIVSRLQALGRSADECWPLMTLMLMNREPTHGVVAYMFSRLREGVPDGSARQILRDASSVSVLICRQLTVDCQIADLDWHVGDRIFISPHLLHQSAVPYAGPDFSFGSGSHTCAGMGIAIAITTSLVAALHKRPLPPAFFGPATNFQRRPILTTLP